MKPQDKFGSSFETAKELPETSWKRKTIQAASAASSQAEAIGKSGGFQGSALSTPVDLREKLEAFLLSLGVSDVGFSKPEAEGLEKTPYAVTLVVRLSNAIVDEIEGEPTLTYFSHYRAVNAFLDQCLLKAGLFLDRAGYQYITVAASQSMNQKGWNYQGRFSHKQAACAAGLGVIGKSSLFLHHRFGPRVRLATLFTDCPFPVENALPASLCGSCRKCVDSCPSGAILGPEWAPGMPRKLLFDPEKCSQHMKRQYQHIGRGAVCGICMRVCPRYERSVIRWE